MAAFFLVDTYMNDENECADYMNYIKKVKPIVENFGGEYLLRSNCVRSLSTMRNPQRVIIIRFPDIKHLEKCFQSEEYRAIMNLRENSVDARAIIVEE